MIIPVKAVRQYAQDAGMSDSFIHQHQGTLESFALRVALGQRNKDQQRIRRWVFDSNPTKCSVLDILTEDD